MFQQILCQIEIFTSSVQNNLSRTFMTTDDILIDKLCHTFSIHSLNCTFFNSFTQIVSCKHSKSKSFFLHSSRQINDVNFYFLSYCHTSCRMQRLLLSYSRSMMTLF